MNGQNEQYEVSSGLEKSIPGFEVDYLISAKIERSGKPAKRKKKYGFGKDSNRELAPARAETRQTRLQSFN